MTFFSEVIFVSVTYYFFLKNQKQRSSYTKGKHASKERKLEKVSFTIHTTTYFNYDDDDVDDNVAVFFGLWDSRQVRKILSSIVFLI